MAKTSKKDSESAAKKPRSKKQLTVRERAEAGATESRRARVSRFIRQERVPFATAGKPRRQYTWQAGPSGSAFRTRSMAGDTAGNMA